MVPFPFLTNLHQLWKAITLVVNVISKYCLNKIIIVVIIIITIIIIIICLFSGDRPVESSL